MDPSGDSSSLCAVFQQQVMKQYQGYSVSSVPLGISVGHPREDDFEEMESDNESVDYELEKSVLKRPPAPVPGQMDKFLHLLKVGFFVGTIEVLTDRGENDLEEIRKSAQMKADELIASTGELIMPEIPGRPICGTPKIKRDLRRMSKHIQFFSDLFNKFIEEFDGSPIRVRKLREATGFIKGILARDGRDVFNITDKPIITEFSDMLDMFKVNAILFLEYIKSHQEQ
uniref:Uncharacterized protein n=2 Tax=Caenorhabditis japonica TaxID=281687 RepID=A0A8R1E5L2_CAEJA